MQVLIYCITISVIHTPVKQVVFEHILMIKEAS